MSKVLVIGSNSFSGADFIDLLLSEREAEVIGVSRSPEKSPLFLPYLSNPACASRYRFYQMDLNQDSEALFELLRREKPAKIVNFAAQSEVAPSWEHPEHWFMTNGVAIAALGNFLRRQDWLERYVHISSPEVYGSCEGVVTESAPLNPTTPYAASKAAGDLMLTTLVKNFEFPLLSVRATNVYGPHQQLFKIIPRTAIYLKMNRKIELHGGGQAVKSYIHIRDVSRGELAIMEQGQTGEIYHLSPGQSVAVREVVKLICDLRGQDFEAMSTPVAERLGQDKAYVISSDKARSELGWSDRIDLKTGLRQVVDWVDHYWDEIQQQPLQYVHKP
ncbi:MAG: dTDP-glucose 4,6-dehydratase [Candidatus Melainabacteria bacterium HGW-Melainabacteria-1]|nr:MAG: dTDP-glucose 4,6-dehydratase [Candidatus Melainabacteria bacterium HGW-Melainabacteria-1]